MAREQAQVAFQNGTKKWRYKGVSADGRTKQKGVIEAQTRDQAIDRVNKLGLIPTELVDVNAGTGLNTNIEIKAFEKYPSKKDFAVMSRQLATMVAAGVSLIRALNIVTEQIGNVKLRNAVRDCMQQVEAGSSFSEAMDNNPDHLFPPIMTNMVRAGETGGFLDKSLITVADSFEADVRLQGQIKGALAYPVVVLGIAVLLVGVMLLVHPEAGAFVVSVLFPIWFIAHCVSRLTHLNIIRFTAGNFYYWFTLIVNVIGIVLGAMMLFRPALAAYSADYLISIYLLLMGVDSLVMAFSRRW